MFYMSSFKIYGGVAGLYDYGPTGAAIKANLQQFWRQHYVYEENMLEVCNKAHSGFLGMHTEHLISDTNQTCIKNNKRIIPCSLLLARMLASFCDIQSNTSCVSPLILEYKGLRTSKCICLTNI